MDEGVPQGRSYRQGVSHGRDRSENAYSPAGGLCGVLYRAVRFPGAAADPQLPALHRSVGGGSDGVFGRGSAQGPDGGRGGTGVQHLPQRLRRDGGTVRRHSPVVFQPRCLRTAYGPQRGVRRVREPGIYLYPEHQCGVCTGGLRSDSADSGLACVRQFSDEFPAAD